MKESQVKKLVADWLTNKLPSLVAKANERDNLFDDVSPTATGDTDGGGKWHQYIVTLHPLLVNVSEDAIVDVSMLLSGKPTKGKSAEEKALDKHLKKFRAKVARYGAGDPRATDLAYEIVGMVAKLHNI
jgi:hypothetical protein